MGIRIFLTQNIVILDSRILEIFNDLDYLGATLKGESPLSGGIHCSAVWFNTLGV